MKAFFRQTLLCAALSATLAGCSAGSDSGNSNSNASSAGQPAGAAGQPAGAGGYGAGGGRGQRFGQMLKELNLTPAQAEQIKVIVAEARKQSEGADPQTRRATMRAAYEKIENTVLNPAQKAEFEKKRAAMRAQYSQPSPSAQ